MRLSGRRQRQRRRDAVEQLALRGALGQAPPQGLAGRRGDAVDQLLLVAALRHREPDAAAAQRQRLRDQVLLDQLVAQQHQRRLRPVVVELADERGQHLVGGKLAVMAREIGAVAPIVAAAEEEHLDAGLAAGLMGRDHIGIDDAGHVDVLVTLHQRQGADAVANQRRRLEVERLGGSIHLRREALLDIAAAPGQKELRLLDQLCIIGAGRSARRTARCTA